MSLKKIPAYRSWCAMMERCNNPKATGWEYYGGRGITVCSEWKEHRKGFKNFLRDLGDRPDGFVLDRIDNDKGYYKENCRWVDRSVSNINQRHHAFGRDCSTNVRGVSFHTRENRWEARVWKKGIILIVVGLGMFLTALWGGAWLCSVFPYGSAYNFPAFLSAFVLAASGVVVGCLGASKLENSKL